MRLIFERARRSCRIPDDIAAGAPSGDSGFIDPADALLQISLEHAVQLKSLASSNSKRSVAQVARDTVVCEVLLRAQRPAGKLGADHEHPGFIEILLFPRQSLVPIILLIGTVEFQELILVVGEVRPVPEKRFLNCTSQGMTLGFDFFDASSSHSSESRYSP